MEKEVKCLYAEISIGAAGAPTLEKALGIASVVQDATGLYTVTLQDKYTRLMSFQGSLQSAAPSTLQVQVVSEDVANTKAIQFRTVDAAAAEGNAASGSVIRIVLDLKNSSV